MIKRRPAYQLPTPPFQPGEMVVYLGCDERDEETGKVFKVCHSGHYHTTVEGRRFAIVNWLLRRKGESRKAYLKRNFG